MSDELRIAVCDDELVVLPQLSSYIKDEFQASGFPCVTEKYAAAAGLLRDMYGGKVFDAYFLDIDMPSQNGIELAGKIRMKTPDALIVFVSGREDMVYETFSVQPLAFVRKSNFKKDLEKAVETVIRHLEKPEDTIIPLKDELGHEWKINITRLQYVKSEQQYQRFVSIDGSELIRRSAAETESLLSPFGFYRIHRSYIVNFRYVYRIDTDSVVLDSGVRLPVSRLRYKDTRRMFMEYSIRT